ncbi:hypothetical protein GJ744_010702 [Endocarpon pusillum]|uniref:GATA-type domain-containing protein n=1 Tax=Endocarpon pusillum TaxID=364733 RepID=A0A8H7E3J6_9EURO|nr:hypothetical protein GJ744_010702 [Endocarpon pusillum]
MEAVDGNSRHRNALAALNRLDMDKITRDGIDNHHKVPTSGLSLSIAPLLSPTTTFPGAQPPYSCSSSATPSNMGTFEYMSPPSSRRTTVDDKASGPRQSLPSIQEALGGDGTKPFSATIVHPLSAPSRGSAADQTSENDPYNPHPVQHQTPHAEQDRIKPRFPSINTTEALAASSHTYQSKSPKAISAHPVPTNSYNQSPHIKNYNPSADTSPTHYPSYRSPYAYSAGSSNPPPSTYPSAPDYSRFNPAFKFDDRKQSIPRSHPSQPYSDSIKRHLDIFDFEMALNEVSEGSSRALEFSRIWNQRAHQRQRSVQLPESLPSVSELDDLLRQSGRVVEAFSRIKEAVITQQHALAEEQARALKRERYDDESTGFSGEYKENGGFAAGDSKKRRGKAAPPGRCHSCNRAETPEWRRGPDGARTLCNACGLHYAKLTRKMAVNKNAGLSGSNLRPKNSEAHSTL